jgi:hypothetical protein
VLRWSDELRIGFCADRLICARIGRALSPGVTHKHVMSVAGDPADPMWRSSLQTLSGVLKEAKGKQVSVILSNRFVRYSVVPWHAALLKTSERLVQARSCFKQIYGDVSDKWAISISEPRYGASVLATAVDLALIEGLRASCREAGARLVSILPYLTAAYGQFRRSLKGVSYFGVVEHDALGVLRFDSGGLRTVYSERIHEDWIQQLRGTLMRDHAESATTAAQQPIRVFAPGRGNDGLRGLASASALSLPARRGYSPMIDSSISMALVGV